MADGAGKAKSAAGLAGVFMFLGMLQFYFAQPLFGNIGDKPIKAVKDENDKSIEEKNEEDFYSKVIELYQNKEKAEELGNNGKEFIEKKFSWEVTSQALVKLYDEL